MDESNPILHYHEEEIKSILSKGENLDRILSRLVRDGIITFSAVFQNDINPLLEDVVLCLDTQTFLRIIREIDLQCFDILCRNIENTWSSIIENVKSSVVERISTLPKFLLWDEKEKFIKLDNILTPIKIRTERKQVLSNCKSLLDGTEFLEEISSNQRILIYGEAGIGKTFHYFKILNKWANGDVCQDYLLLSVKLVDVKRDQDFLDAVLEQNSTLTSKRKLDKRLLQYYLSDSCNDSQRKVIFLLDGADEYGFEESELFKIIHGMETIRHPVIVWTRTFNIEKIRDSYDTIMEIIGFDNNHKREFFNKFFSSNTEIEQDQFILDVPQGDQLYQFLAKERPDLLQSCSNPLIAIITAAVWEKKRNSFKKDCNIFEDAINILMKKSSIDVNSSKFNDLLEYYGAKALRNLLFYEPILLDEQMDWTGNLGGLIVLKTINNDKRSGKEFRFIHFLLQEYFVAKFIIYILNKKPSENEMDTTDSSSHHFYHSYHDSHQDHLLLIQDICTKSKIFFFKRVLEFIQQIDESVYGQLLNNNQDILTLLQSVDDDVISLVKDRDYKEEIIEFKNTKISSFLLEIILQNNLKNLKILVLKNVIIDIEKFLENSLKYEENLLESLTISYTKSFSRQKVSLEIIQNACCAFKQLKTLILKNFNFYSDDINQLFQLYSKKIENLQILNSNLNIISLIGDINELKSIDFSSTKLKGKCSISKLFSYNFLYIF